MKGYSFLELTTTLVLNAAAARITADIAAIIIIAKPPFQWKLKIPPANIIAVDTHIAAMLIALAISLFMT